MKDVYLVSDVHGRHEALLEALYDARLFDNHGQRTSDSLILQIGDLANCVGDPNDDEDDMSCLNMVGKEIDVMLVGNHEMPYFDNHNRFGGFRYDEFIAEKMRDLLSKDLIVPAFYFSSNDTLVTHAGVSASHLTPQFQTGLDVFKKIEAEWSAGNYQHHIFSDCGRARYGNAPVGGSLWCDFDQEFEPTPFPQIVGHTPGILRQKGNALCIDTGAKSGGKPTVMRLG